MNAYRVSGIFPEYGDKILHSIVRSDLSPEEIAEKITEIGWDAIIVSPASQKDIDQLPPLHKLMEAAKAAREGTYTPNHHSPCDTCAVCGDPAGSTSHRYLLDQFHRLCDFCQQNPPEPFRRDLFIFFKCDYCQQLQIEMCLNPPTTTSCWNCHQQLVVPDAPFAATLDLRRRKAEMIEAQQAAEEAALKEKRLRSLFRPPLECPTCGENQWSINAVSPNEKSVKWECGYCQKSVIIKSYETQQRDDQTTRDVIPDEVRLKVWRRDGGKCVKCGSKEKIEYDHIIPRSRGGSNTVRNIELLCEKCNRTKSDSEPGS